MQIWADKRRAKVAFALLLATVGWSCGGNSDPAAAPNASTPNQKIPFPQALQSGAGGSSTPAVPPEPKSTTGVPFKSAHAQSLPAGTLLTVSLDLALSDAKTRAGESFSAAVADPVVIDGSTLVARGTAVSGRVESIQHSLVGDRGWYVRLILEELDLNGNEIPLQTSTLLTRGTSIPAENGTPGGTPPREVTQLRKGRRLTFRLTTPAALDRPPSPADLPSGTR